MCVCVCVYPFKAFCPFFSWQESLHKTSTRSSPLVLTRSFTLLPAVDNASLMVGSYGPRPESQEFVSAARAAPQGMMSYGQYVVKSRFIDDDKVVHLEWEWNVAIKKDWD